jgi:hypothetical protein
MKNYRKKHLKIACISVMRFEISIEMTTEFLATAQGRGCVYM